MHHPFQLQRFFLTLVIYLSVCIYSYVFITPYSFISFIGPAAGITTALVVFWGSGILLAVVVATILFCLFLYFWLNLPIESSMVIITLLALMLQGFWAKQLTFAEVNKHKWLKSRRSLLIFLFKVGPVISLVSASTVVILTTLENQMFGDNLFFVFVCSWSASTLISIFFTPLFLLSQDQLSISKRVFIIVSSLLAIICIGLLFNISQNVQQHQRQDTFNQVQNKVLQNIQQEIASTIEQVNSLSALFKSTEQVSRREFELFAQHVFQNNSSVRALTWAPIITHENRAEFTKVFGSVNEKNIKGELQESVKRNIYAPIKYLYPSLNNGQYLGFDVLKNLNTVIDINKLMSHEGVVASAPLRLGQNEFANLDILFISAVYFENNTTEQDKQEQSKQKQGKENNLLGFVLASVQFESFFKKILPLKSDDVMLFIEDVTQQEPYTLFGKPLNESYRHIESTTLYVNSRVWRISIGESQPWQMQEKNWQIWAMLGGVTLGGVLFQVLILMMVVYSNELSAQVVRKTRELILAKEKSEHKNKAMTNFVYTLTNEFGTPLQAISHFTKQLHKADSQKQKNIIQDIDLAINNMQKLLGMVADLSKIELGELVVNKAPLDFYGFLARIDSMLKANKSNRNNQITFLIDPSVPHFINSDELKIQQLLVAFCHGVHQLYDAENIRLSIKVHTHKFNSATLLFVFTSHNNEVSHSIEQFQHFILKGISSYSAEVAMAKKVCQLMGGDASLAISDSGKRILTASIKIEITSNEQQQVYQAQTFDDIDDFN